MSKFLDGISKLKFGMPWEQGVEITPLPEPEKPGFLKELIEDATNKGAKVVNQNGGTIHETFFVPAVLYPVNSQMKVYDEEQFGPLIPIASFDSIEEPIQYIVDSNYGQQVSIFGTNADIMADLVDKLVNAPASLPMC